MAQKSTEPRGFPLSSPVSLGLLIHSATLYPYTGTVNSVKTYGAAVNLTQVRFTSVKQDAMTSLGEMKNDKFKMTFDSANSAPSGTLFKVNDKIVYGTSTLAVRAVTTSYSSDLDPHHQEVSLV